MDHSTFMQKIEEGEIEPGAAIQVCIPLYQSSWSSIMSMRQIFDKIGEHGTSMELAEAVDALDRALDDHFEVNEDGVLTVRS